MMDIEKIVFEFRETKIYTLTVSSENGWDMPEDGNRLVELVNEIKGQPHKFIADSVGLLPNPTMIGVKSGVFA